MSAVANDARKRNKKRYVAGHHNKRWKGSRELEVGMQGILITCNMNERKCTAEAFNLLNEYADNLYGPEKVSPEALQYSLVYISALREDALITLVLCKESKWTAPCYSKETVLCF